MPLEAVVATSARWNMLKYVVGPALMVTVIGGIATLSVVAQEAWLAPSIAAAAFTQLFAPLQAGARPYTIVLGQVVGALAGFAGVYAAHAATAAKLMGDHDLPWDRAAAVVIAVAITAVVQIAIEARSPAGGTTAVVVAVGAEAATLAGGLRLLGGIVLVAVLGEIARQIMIRVEPKDDLQPSPPA